MKLYARVVAVLAVLLSPLFLRPAAAEDAGLEAWAARYAATPPARRGAAEAEGVRLARERRERMRDLVRNDPAQALRRAWSEARLSRLPPAVRGLVEQPVRGRAGTSLFRAGAEDDPDPRARDLIVHGRVYRAYVHGRRERQRVFRNEPVEGVAIGNLLALADAPSPRADPPAGRRDGELRLVFSFQPDQLVFSRTEEGDVVEFPGSVFPERPPGMPLLPAFFTNVTVPAGAIVTEVTAAPVERLVRTGFRPRPAQPEMPRSAPRPPFAPPDAAAYASPDRFPAQVMERQAARRLRGFTFVPLQLHPLRWEAATGNLFLADEIAVTVRYLHPAAPPVARDRRPRFTASARALSDPADVPDAEPEYAEDLPAAEGDGGGLPAGLCDYLVITKASLTNAFRTLADHRAAFNGFSTEIVTVEAIQAAYDGTRPDGGSDTQTKIRNCIRDYVQNRGTEYVVLGGDDTIVPDRDCLVVCGSYTNKTAPTDLYYAGLDGEWDDLDTDGVYGEANVDGLSDEGDLGADVFVGRIPVRTAAQASNYFRRLILHDTNPPWAIAKNFILGGHTLWDTYTGNDRPSDAMNDGHAAFRADNHPTVSDAEMWARRTFRDSVQAYGWAANRIGCAANTLTSWDTATAGDCPIAPTNLVRRFSEGWHYLIFDTHGSSSGWSTEAGSFTSSHALSLTGETLVVYTMACNSGGFESAEPSLSEGFLRATNGGALVYLGSSRYGWGSPDAPPAGNYSTGGTSCNWMRKLFQIVIQDGVRRIGDAFYRHKAAYLSSSGNHGAARWLQMSLNLQGDPALDDLGEMETPRVRVEALTPFITEGGSETGRVAVTREGSTSGRLTIRYERGGSAVCGTHYSTDPLTDPEGTFDIPDGESFVHLFISPKDDDAAEGLRTITFTVQPDTSYALGDAATAIVELREDDTDGDGMWDDWEVLHGLDPGVPDGDSHSDDDPFTDGQEFVAGTDPRDGSSYPAVTGAAADAGFRLSFPSAAGRVYRVDWCTGLLDPSWQVLAEDLAGTGSPLMVEDPSADPCRFYRLCVEVAR